MKNKTNKNRQIATRKPDKAGAIDTEVAAAINTSGKRTKRFAAVIYALVFWLTIIPWEFFVYYYDPQSVIILKYKFPLLFLVLILPYLLLGFKKGMLAILFAIFSPLMLPFAVFMNKYQFNWDSFLRLLIIEWKLALAFAVSRFLRFFSFMRVKVAIFLAGIATVFLAYDIGTYRSLYTGAWVIQSLGAVAVVVAFYSYVAEVEWLNRILSNAKVAKKSKKKPTENEIKQTSEDHVLIIYFLLVIVAMLKSLKIFTYSIAVIIGRGIKIFIIALLPAYVATKMLIATGGGYFNLKHALETMDVFQYIFKCIIMQDYSIMQASGQPATLFEMMLNIYGILILVVFISIFYQAFNQSETESFRKIVGKIEDEIDDRKQQVRDMENGRRSFIAVADEMRRSEKYGPFIMAVERQVDVV